MKYKGLEYLALVIALPFMAITFVLGAIYGGLLAGIELARESL
jgi:hypothetical protein